VPARGTTVRQDASLNSTRAINVVILYKKFILRSSVYLKSVQTLMTSCCTMKRKSSRSALGSVVIAAILACVAAVGLLSYFFIFIPPCPNQSADGLAFYVHVISDRSNDSVAGAIVSATTIVTCASDSGSVTHTQTDKLPESQTPTNGIVEYLSPGAGVYSVAVDYMGRSYAANVTISPLQMTNLTLSIPSGTYQIVHSRFGTP